MFGLEGTVDSPEAPAPQDIKASAVKKPASMPAAIPKNLNFVPALKPQISSIVDKGVQNPNILDQQAG
jgi:hypothetical protein